MSAADAAFSLPATALEQRVWHACQTELRKLAAQLIIRLLALVCVVGPFALAAVLRVQSGTPADALFGAYVHSSGFALSLVVLGFAGSWGFPLIAGLVAGDMFASEDRHNTWKTILTRSCSLGELFAGKALAAAACALGLLTIAALASLAAGTLFEGAHGLIGLSGSLLSPGHALVLTVLSWLLCAFPVLSYVSLAVLLSVASRNGIVGVIGTIVVALAVQLLDLIGHGVWAHLLFIGSTFNSFYGLFTAHVFLGPLLVSLVVSLAWTAGCLTAAWMILRRPRSVTPASCSSSCSALRSPRAHGSTSSRTATAAAPRRWGRATGSATSTCTCRSRGQCRSSGPTSNTTSALPPTAVSRRSHHQASSATRRCSPPAARRSPTRCSSSTAASTHSEGRRT